MVNRVRRCSASERLRIAACTLLAGVALPACAQGLDFFQLDLAENDSTLVALLELTRTQPGRPSAIGSFTASRWDSGESAAVGAVARWELGAGSGWLLGLGAGVGSWRTRGVPDEHSEAGPALRGQIEWYGPLAEADHGYLLLQGSSFRQAWFGTLQYMPHALAIGIELSAYRETGYHSSTLGLRWMPGERKRWSIRAGASRADGRTQPFVGFGYNGF